MNPERNHDAADAERVNEEALRWAVRKLDIASWTPEDEAALSAWRAGAPSHEAAFQRHTAVVALMSRPEVFGDEVRCRALAAPEVRPPARRRLLWGAVAAVAAIALGIFLFPRAEVRQFEFRTGVAERREVELPDGSRVHLDARTHLVGNFAGEGREVQLLAGAGVFRVRPDAARPFEVLAGAQVVRVVGTVFEVKHLGGDPSGASDIAVAVTEGVVDVRTREENRRWSSPVRLDAGKAARWTAGRAAPQVAAVSPASFASWRAGRLLCEGDPLTEVVASLQRYSPVRIELAETALGDLRVSGTLPLDDFEAAARLLENVLPVRVRRVGGDRLRIEEAVPNPAAGP